MTDVVRRGARGGGTIVANQVIKLLVQTVGVVVLARLLNPLDYGIIAMVAVVLALADQFRDFGMSTAALQAKDLSQQQASNVFWISSGLGLIAAIIVSLMTPLLVAFYSEPRLFAVVPAMAIGLLLGGMQTQLQVQLARRMRFTALAVTDVIAMTIALVGAILAATIGLGYWALVIQSIGSGVALLALRLAVTRWRPSIPRRRSGSRKLVAAGTDFGMAQFLAFAANNADTMAIGSVWGATPLGYYNRAFQLYLLPRSILDPLTSVVVPTFNALIAEGSSLGSLLLRLQFVIGIPLTWVYLMLAATAPWLISTVLGSQWSPAVGMVQVLAVAGWFAPFGITSYWSFILHDQSRQLLYQNLITKPFTVVLIVLSVPYGPLAVAGAYALSLAVSWPVNLVWLARTAHQDSSKFLGHGLIMLFAAGAAFSAVGAAFHYLDQLGPFAAISLSAGGASVIFFSIAMAFPQARSQLRDGIWLARSALRSRARG